MYDHMSSFVRFPDAPLWSHDEFAKKLAEARCDKFWPTFAAELVAAKGDPKKMGALIDQAVKDCCPQSKKCKSLTQLQKIYLEKVEEMAKWVQQNCINEENPRRRPGTCPLWIKQYWDELDFTPRPELQLQRAQAMPSAPTHAPGARHRSSPISHYQPIGAPPAPVCEPVPELVE